MVEQRQFVPLQALHVLQDKAEMLDGRQTQLFLERSHDILGEEETIQLPKDSANFIFLFLNSFHCFFVLLPLRSLSTYRNCCGCVVLEGLCLSVFQEHLQDIGHRRHTQITQREGGWLR